MSSLVQTTLTMIMPLFKITERSVSFFKCKEVSGRWNEAWIWLTNILIKD